MGQGQPTAQQFMRLDAIAKNLKVKSRYPHPDFVREVTDACMERVAPVIDKLLPCSGEDIALGLSEHLGVAFEEVHGPDDITDLERRYLRGLKEIGFAQLRDELAGDGVDALLFQRMHAKEKDRDRWIAVLNFQKTKAKGYWNRHHELTHRVAEPPQRMLPFRRHQFEAGNPVESLIDTVASEFAFYAPAFRPQVNALAKHCKLSIDVVEAIRQMYAPSASLQATLIAVVKYWPSPAAALIAQHRGRKRDPGADQALRVTPQRYSKTANAAGLRFFDNMRVSRESPIYEVFETAAWKDAYEHLGDWSTSTGDRLQPIDVYTSARMIGKRVYAVVSV